MLRLHSRSRPTLRLVPPAAPERRSALRDTRLRTPGPSLSVSALPGITSDTNCAPPTAHFPAATSGCTLDVGATPMRTKHVDTASRTDRPIAVPQLVPLVI